MENRSFFGDPLTRPRGPRGDDRATRPTVIEPTDTPPAKPAGKWGRNQLAAIVALKEWARAHPDSSHISTPDMAALLKTQGIRHQRRHEVLNSLVNARILTASIGGYTFDREAL